MEHVVLYALVPIVAIMLLGYVSGKRGVFSLVDAGRFNKVVLDFALPAALFISIVRADRSMLVADLRLTVVAAAAVMVCFMAVYFVFAHCFKANSGAEGAVAALLSGSPAIGFLGFAVLEPVFGEEPEVALVVAIVGIVVNAIGIPVGLFLLGSSLARQTPGAGEPDVRGAVLKALSNPVAWAPVLAVVLVLCGVKWPEWASPSFDLLAKANSSLAVFSAGITLSAIKVSVNGETLLGVFFKLVLMPAAALAMGVLFNMEVRNIYMLVVACALPPAFSGIMIADKYNVYVSTGTSSLALGILLFVVVCPLWLYVMQAVVGACPGMVA